MNINIFSNFIKINKEDSVAVALKTLEKGSVLLVDGEEVLLQEEILHIVQQQEIIINNVQ